MELNNITGTKNTPSLKVLANDKIVIVGRSYPEDVSLFFNPVIDYIKQVKCDTFSMDIFLDYFNTASSKKLLEMFNGAEANRNINNVNIVWRYEVDDEDSLDMAETYEDQLEKCNFKYIEVAESAV